MTIESDWVDRVRSYLYERGDFVMAEDGYWVYWPTKAQGFLNATELRIVADYLDTLNREWHERVTKHLTDIDIKERLRLGEGP